MWWCIRKREEKLYVYGMYKYLETPICAYVYIMGRYKVSDSIILHLITLIQGLSMILELE